MTVMQSLMAGLRKAPPASIAGLAVESVVDYSAGGTGLPAADVLEYRLAGGAKFMVYLSAVGKSEAEADAVNERMAQAAAEMMHA